MKNRTREKRSTLGFLIQISLYCVALLAFASETQAQNYLQQTGAPTFATVEPVELGFVDASNGNLHIEIPLTAPPQRGSLVFGAKLVYDSRIWQPMSNIIWEPTNVPGSQAGWRLLQTGVGTVSVATGSQTCYYTCGPGGKQCPAMWKTYSNYSYTDSAGTSRAFPIYFETGNQCHTAGPSTNAGNSLDATGYYMSAYAGGVNYVLGPDGTQVYPTLKDTNGNCFDTSTTDSPGTCSTPVQGANVVDTLNRTPLASTTSGNQTTYTILTSQGSSNIVVSTSTIYYHTAFGQSGVTEVQGHFTAITSIQLPGSLGTYQFNYDTGTSDTDPNIHYGLLTSITLPTGGQITYAHTNFTDANGNINQWVHTRTSNGGPWTYTPAATCGSNCQTMTVQRPSGDNTVYTFSLGNVNGSLNGAWKTTVQYYTGTVSPSNLLETVQNTYTTQTDPVDGGSGFIVPNSTTETLTVPSGNLVKQTTYSYDTYTYSYRGTNYTGSLGKLKNRSEYAFGSGSTGGLARQNVFTYLDDANSAYKGVNIVNRITDAQVQNSSGSKIAETIISYDSTGLSTFSGATHHDDSNYGSGFTTRGNPTVVQRLASGSTYLSTTLGYDTTGQVLSVTDPNNNTTTLSYTDNFFVDGTVPVPSTTSPGVTTNAYVTKITRPVTQTLLNGSVNHITQLGYFYNTGKTAKMIDENGYDSYTHFLDSLDRLTHMYGQPMSGSRPWTLVNYTSAELRDVYTGITDTNASTSCSVCRHDQVTLDGLFRPTKTSLVSDPGGQDNVDTHYDSAGRVSYVSNPYRSGSVGDSYAYDGLNRVIMVTHADNNFAKVAYGSLVSGTGVNPSQLCPSGTYGLGYPTLFTDEAGNRRELWTDAFGRTIEVDEPDSTGNLTSLNTCYSYDLLNDLTQVKQGTSQTRTYAYDALSRLTSSATPESANCGTIYTYDNNSNVSTRFAPKPNQTTCPAPGDTTHGVTTTYGYDALNRLTSKTYSDTTPAAYIYYDESSVVVNQVTYQLYNTKGRISHTTAAGATAQSFYNYDPVGRVMDYSQCTLDCTNNAPAVFLATHYNYDLAGDVTSWNHPNGFTLTNTINNAQQITQISSSWVDSLHPATLVQSMTYTPFGAIDTLVNGCTGTGCTRQETYDYNNRLQPVRIQLGTSGTPAANYCLVYNYYGVPNPTTCTNTPTQATTGNNGNVMGHWYQDSINSSLSHTASYTYDPLNRLATAVATGSSTSTYNLTFSYDRYGNMACVTNGRTNGPCPNFTFNTSNHITTSGYTYDAAGNLTADGTGTGSHTYQWDAEDRLTQVTPFGGSAANFTYNAYGWRVYNSGGPVSYLLDPSGQFLGGRWNGGGNSAVFLGSRMLAEYMSNGVDFDHPNALGSDTQMTDYAGNGGQAILYYPWGQKVPGSSNLYGSTFYQRYASLQQYDTSTDGYVPPFRYYIPEQGRWLTPDPLAGDILNPQSLNRYTYALNSPCSYTDPLGLDPCSFNISINNSVLSQSQIKILARTLSGIFNAAGVGVNFSFSDPADFTLIVTGAAARADLNDPGAAPQLISGGFGNTPLSSNGSVGTIGYVFPGLVSNGYNLYNPSRLAVVVGRVAAHEAGHSLLQIGGKHGGVPYGIMTAAPNLLDPHIGFTGGEAIQLQSRCDKRHPRPPSQPGGGSNISSTVNGYVPPGFFRTCAPGKVQTDEGDCVPKNTLE